MGLPILPRSAFQGVQRPWLWRDERPRLGKESWARLAGRVDATLPTLTGQHRGADGTTRLLFTLADGAPVEAVHMPRAVRSPRVSLCLSTQVGCAMGCAFCATGGLGLRRNLSAAEMVAQVSLAMRHLGPSRGHALSLVFMGMGEPLCNVDALERALEVLCHPAGLGIPERRITVSTSGWAPGIARLAAMRRRPALALSLVSAHQALRATLMPVARRWSLAALREALVAWPLRAHEKITLEVVLLAGLNDRLADALELLGWCGDLLPVVNVNIIPFNSYPGALFEAPSVEVVQAFIKVLQDRGARVTLRASRGQDVQGACGQLAAGRLQARSFST